MKCMNKLKLLTKLNEFLSGGETAMFSKYF